MAQTTTISTKELKRQASLVFEGKTLNVMLCELTNEGFTVESTVTQWQTIEKSGNGYERYFETIAVGSYDTALGLYRIPTINASFTASAPYSYNCIVIYVTGETYIHSLISESPNIVLSAGQTQTYAISLRQDS